MSKASTSIKPDILIADLLEIEPEVAIFLLTEYGIHCVNCFAAAFDTLEEGARIHGIVGADFEELLQGVEAIVFNKKGKNEEKVIESKSEIKKSDDEW